MKIIGKNIESMTASAAVKIKAAPRQNTPAEYSPKRDRAEFDRDLISYLRKIKSSVKAEFDAKQTAPKISITSEEISAEIERLKSGAKKASDSESVSQDEAIASQEENVSSETAANKPSDNTAANKSSDGSAAAKMLEEQRDRLNSLFSKTKKTDKSLSGIRNKIRQGQKLTAAEQRYLSAKDPKAYESYCKISTARSMFRCSLNNCRTRDEVTGMRLSNALSALASYKKAIREGGDGGDVIALNAAFENELKSFSKSPGYRSLPTAAECDKFDRDIAKARRYEQEKRLEKQREAQRLRSKRYKKTAKKIKIPGDGKRTVAQVLADPASKKVLASRAKRTYCECASASVSVYKGLNSKA